MRGNVCAFQVLAPGTRMITIVFAAFLALAAMVAITDWRRGVLMLILVGVLQDPARKLTPGTPFLMTMSVVLIYAAIIIAIQAQLQSALADFTSASPPSGPRSGSRCSSSYSPP
jgi:hypothetical protein